MKTIWLFGASQGLGLEIAKHYTSQGYQVNAMVRDLNKVDKHALTNLNWVKGDALVAQDIANFMLGAKQEDWVYLLHG